jgi:hypothetical protein
MELLPQAMLLALHHRPAVPFAQKPLQLQHSPPHWPLRSLLQLPLLVSRRWELRLGELLEYPSAGRQPSPLPSLLRV